MKRWIAALGLLGVVTLTHAEVGAEFRSSGRYEMFSNPQGNRIYVLDTQTGRMFQLVHYKEINKEILEEVPYVFGSSRVCTPSEYETSGKNCFSKNYDYIKSLLDVRREQRESQVAPVTTPKPE